MSVPPKASYSYSIQQCNAVYYTRRDGHYTRGDGNYKRGDRHYKRGTDTIKGGTETLYKVRSNLKMLT